jgi:hypothetical protein
VCVCHAPLPRFRVASQARVKSSRTGADASRLGAHATTIKTRERRVLKPLQSALQSTHPVRSIRWSVIRPLTWVELRGLEPLTPCLQSRCSSS